MLHIVLTATAAFVDMLLADALVITLPLEATSPETTPLTKNTPEDNRHPDSGSCSCVCLLPSVNE